MRKMRPLVNIAVNKIEIEVPEYKFEEE